MDKRSKAVIKKTAYGVSQSQIRIGQCKHKNGSPVCGEMKVLVRRQIIITGDLEKLKDIFGELETAAKAAAYKVRDASSAETHHRAWGITPKNSENDIEFFLDFEESNNQIRVWTPPDTSREEAVEWNHVLEQFFEDIVLPIANGVAVHLTENEKDIEEFYGPSLAEELKKIAKMGECGTRTRMIHEFTVRAAAEINGSYDSELGHYLEEVGWQEKDICQFLEDYRTAHWVLSEFFRQNPDKKPKKDSGPD